MSVKPVVTVIGLGPAGVDLLTSAATDAIARVSHRYVRTTRHPSASAVEPATSFDSLYESAGTIDSVYLAIVERLVAMAQRHGEVLYAVPGSPVVAEHTVEMLIADDRVEARVIPALSFLDLAWVRLAIDPIAKGVSIVDGHRFVEEAAGRRAPLFVSQCDAKEVLSNIKLAIDTDLSPYDGVGPTVRVLQRLGSPDEKIFDVAWNDLDRAVEPDHLTSIYIDEMRESVGESFVKLDQLMHTLRAQCPWDREQTLQSLTKYLVEEAYEVIEAIEIDDPAKHVDELGDVLLQIFFQACIAEEKGDFTISDVARGITSKMVRRHPHVFPPGDGSGRTASTADDVAKNWEEIKQEESGPTRTLARVSDAMPSLILARKLQSKAASAGFDWSDIDGPLDKIGEEVRELRDELAQTLINSDRVLDELGDVLFSVVNVARKLDLDPEQALRISARKFRARFDAVEDLAIERGIDMKSASIGDLDALWNEVKAR